MVIFFFQQNLVKKIQTISQWRAVAQVVCVYLFFICFKK
jgi:hypothetical protein